MTAPQVPSSIASLGTTDSYIRGAGREFLLTLYAALRSLRLYPVENPVVQRSLDDIQKMTDRFAADVDSIVKAKEADILAR